MKKVFVICLLYLGVTAIGCETSPPEGMVLIPAGEFQMGSNNNGAKNLLTGVDPPMDNEVVMPPLLQNPLDKGYDHQKQAPNPLGEILLDQLSPPPGFEREREKGYDQEKPVHTVYVDAFYIDTYEVTNADYTAFLNAKGKHAESVDAWLDIEDWYVRIELVNGVYRAKAGYENHPVVNVSWYGAMAYAKWVRKRLPTEAEWEKAARGGLVGLNYPWGNSIDFNRANYEEHIRDTTAVGKYPANGYGLYDMCGNVWEWCLDEYDADFYTRSPSQNPVSGANSIDWIVDNYTGIKGSRVLRGGSWLSKAQDVRVTTRGSLTPGSTGRGSGFRCAKSVSP